LSEPEFGTTRRSCPRRTALLIKRPCLLPSGIISNQQDFVHDKLKSFFVYVAANRNFETTATTSTKHLPLPYLVPPRDPSKNTNFDDKNKNKNRPTVMGAPAVLLCNAAIGSKLFGRDEHEGNPASDIPTVWCDGRRLFTTLTSTNKLTGPGLHQSRDTGSTIRLFGMGSVTQKRPLSCPVKLNSGLMCLRMTTTRSSNEESYGFSTGIESIRCRTGPPHGL
jgi:hypothetical protein